MKLLDICSTVTAVSGAMISAMAGIAAVVGAIWISIITFGPQPVVVGDVAVPPSLVQRGFTATIMARRLSDEIGRLSHSSATEGVEAVLFERTPDGVLPSLNTSASEGLWQPVERALRAISGNRTRTISGEIVENVGPTTVPLYEGRLRHGDVVISDRQGVFASSSLDALIHDMAFDIYRSLDPTRAAYVAWTLGNLNAMRLALRPVLGSSDIDPSSATALFLLADLELKHGDLAAAEDHVLRGLAKRPRHPLGLHHWGRILQAKGLLADALAVAAEACRLDMQSPSGCSLLGALHLEQAVLAGGDPRQFRQFRQAHQAFLRALSVDESNEDALGSAAHAAAASGDYPEALRLIDMALAKAPRNAGHLLRKTWIMFRGGDLGYADRLLSELLNKNPDLLAQQPASNAEAHLKLDLIRFADMRKTR
jgi:tetratricopeptide (TPR) repeat protein